jgi:hypothetical protein
MFEFGQTQGALLLFPEHRFYGKSLPFGPVDSYAKGNVQGLKISEALKDYVAIIGEHQWLIFHLSAVPSFVFSLRSSFF